jgi:hypothetical protein
MRFTASTEMVIATTSTTALYVCVKSGLPAISWLGGDNPFASKIAATLYKVTTFAYPPLVVDVGKVPFMKMKPHGCLLY